MTNQNTSPDQKRNKKMARLLLFILLGFFGIVVVANVVLVTLANKSWNGLWVTDAYEKGLSYNETLEKRDAEKNLGWNLGLNMATTPNGHQMNLLVTKKGNAPLTGAMVTVALKRPTHKGADKTIVLLAAGDGIYSAPIKLPLKGQWHALITVNHKEGTMQAQKRLHIQ